MNIPTIPLKNGVSTSEFWVVIISGLLLTAQSAIGLLDVGWAMGGVTVLGLLYTSIRGRLKTIHAQTAADTLKAQIEAQPTGMAGTPPPNNVIPFQTHE